MIDFGFINIGFYVASAVALFATTMVITMGI